jgi:CheY-like chemotaxis protein
VNDQYLARGTTEERGERDGRDGVKVAIVEDEVILAMALTLMLEDWGHQVVGTADTEAGAAALAESKRPDAILMDIRLGRKESGLRAARVIRETSDVPIVFCTAYADSAPIQAEIRTLENAHLVGKPVDEEHLEWLLRRIEDRRRKASSASPFVSTMAMTLQPTST